MKQRYFLLTGFLLLFIFTGLLQAKTEIISLDGTWKVAFDRQNKGKKEEWFRGKYPEARELTVPGRLETLLPGHHGVAWYSRTFRTPQNDDPNGRIRLRFWQVYYYAEVWVNEQYVGQHEGGEEPFTFDITDFLRKEGRQNTIAVRVVNVRASFPVIDNFSRWTIPERGTHTGGLADSVELFVSPAVYIDDLHLIPDPKTGELKTRVRIVNTLETNCTGALSLTAALDKGSESGYEQNKGNFSGLVLAPGENLIEKSIMIPHWRLWDLNEPNLYFVTAQFQSEDQKRIDIKSDRCGFRDFRFENGAFRLNGKRIYIKCSHTGSDSPIGYRIPIDPDIFRRDIYNCKVMNFNMIRFIAGTPRRFWLDVCDEYGLMAYEECCAAWFLRYSPEREERYRAATEGMIKRDRNHPSIVCWGLLNETNNNTAIMQAFHMLKRVQELGPGHLFFFNSGSWDSFKEPVEESYPFACWRTDPVVTPFVGINQSGKEIDLKGSKWPDQVFALHPGIEQKNNVVIRWTAPIAGTYKVDAQFKSLGKTSVDIKIIRPGKYLLEKDLFDRTRKELTYSESLSFKKGDTLWLHVGNGGDGPKEDLLAVEMTITDPKGKVYDLKKDFSTEKNPNGPWTYGHREGKGYTSPEFYFELFSKGENSVNVKSGVIGRIANPGSLEWQNLLSDIHPYRRAPHDALILNRFRTFIVRDLPIFVSEYGVGSGIHLSRILRKHEEYNARFPNMEASLKEFMKYWKEWRMEDTFASPDDFFDQTLRIAAEHRRYGLTAIRSNPSVVAHSITATQDHGLSGEGITTSFRELKPGSTDLIADIFSPLRLNLFVEPRHIYSGQKGKFEAVLSNEDILAPGRYPVRWTVTGPNNVRLYDKVGEITIPEPPKGKENPFAIPVFSEEIELNGPSGEYHFRADLLKGGAPTGGKERFFMTNRKDLPAIKPPLVVWRQDKDLIEKLKAIGITPIEWKDAVEKKFLEQPHSLRPILLAGVDYDYTEQHKQTLRELFTIVEHGKANVIFLDPKSTSYLPFDEKEKGELSYIHDWLYRKDDWNRFHPFFEGLPCGGVLDPLFYRELMPAKGYLKIKTPDEIAAGAFNTNYEYKAYVTIGVYKHGKGKFVLNLLPIRTNLGKDPAAERLLRNMINNL